MQSEPSTKISLYKETAYACTAAVPAVERAAERAAKCAALKIPIEGDEDILRHVRLQREREHRNDTYWVFVNYPLEIPATQPKPRIGLPQIDFSHLQDLCNKSVVLYSRTCPPPVNMASLFLFMKDRWSCGDIHHTNIEFSRFFAKHIRILPTHPSRLSSSSEVKAVHSALIQRLREKEPMFSNPMSSRIPGLATQQTEHFKLGPVFSALFMIIEDPAKPGFEDYSEVKVRLVRTGVPVRSGTPFSFDCLGPTIKDEVLTTLPEAIDFVLDLERQEEAISPTARDESALDYRLQGKPADMTQEYRNKYGYSGGELQGPSTSWVKDWLD